LLARAPPVSRDSEVWIRARICPLFIGRTVEPVLGERPRDSPWIGADLDAHEAPAPPGHQKRNRSGL
jgi:hypothetical protein